MTLSIERARSRRPVTRLTIAGIILLPAVIGGLLASALYNPVERLDNMSAAIVNEDEPVTLDGQLIPLGRQLSAGLVEGSDDLASNLNWVVSNPEDAAEGLADGTYQAVVTIPENFSAAATSTAPGSTPEQATINVTTPPDAKIVDDAITAQITTAAASILGRQLSEVYLENVFLGFTTLSEQLGEAATGAYALADGTTDAATGARSLADGIPLLTDGATGLSNGAQDLSSGLSTLSTKTSEAAAGAGQLAAGVNAGADQVVANGIVPSELTAAADGSAAASAGVAQGLATLISTCNTTLTPEFCAGLSQLQVPADGAAQAAAGTSYGLGQLAAQAPQQFAGQLRTIGSNVATLSGGLGQIAGGIGQSATGAGSLSTGARDLAGGISQVGTGASSLADGISTLATGTGTLADGLDEASKSIPSYTTSEAQSLATVVADPVAATGNDTNLFGASAIPLLATLALWFGGFASFVALQAAPRQAVSSRAPSALLALKALAPAAAIGTVQGLLVAGAVQIAASYAWDAWWMFALVSVIAGIAFAAINQAFVAALGGAGRWIAALIGVLAVATGVVSTVPGVLSAVAGLMPTSPAYTGMLGALTAAGGLGAGIVGLLVWSVIAFIVTTVAVARRRLVRSRDLLVLAPVAV
jgi:putative membrane protein